MATKLTTLEHADVGKLTGIQAPAHPEVEQYLGIQYAKLANRFARGTLVETFLGPIEATSVGRLPIANPNNCDSEHRLFQHTLPHPEYEFSETECLTLNVSLPSSRTTNQTLPVVVFVHGGGFVTGSASWPQYDLAALVAHSVKIGKPTIAVGINYRLGIFGFLTSSALREAGYQPNNGLDDQKLGFRWVQKHISGFGGDPTRVTYLGSSAGGAAGFHHLQANEPLFSQLVALGGSPLIQPIPINVAEIAYGIAIGALGLDKLPPAEQVQALLDIPAQDLRKKLDGAGFPLTAVVDEHSIKVTPTLTGLADTDALKSLFPGVGWCKSIMMGDAQLDGMIIGITALAHRTDNLATLPILHFINDIVFAQGAKATAQAWARAGPRLGTKSFLTHFNMPNPWAGPWQGHASHALDAAIVLGNFNEYLSDGQRACAEKMASDLLTFVNGQDPFPPYSGGEGGASMVYYAEVDSKEDASRVVENSSESGRRTVLEDIAGGQTEVLDKLLGAFGLLLQGPKR
ncbi:hypothetical protein M406DRAFT_49189 [Cryphonectria parasitica EP155]|uniref:Carboxylesterase type B domain-containing protein n=1 Tax=Cryphonectria parasitica (strain ATCC 38755 / EP155) TaxID=660469 RepID=A0A9P4XZE3_CRYP1|nr:uncharacterized protein M406DRAFT_49189 [Cryphonectria parasitica EP155]KAF3763587.1 hypothetical protein M406DRAFT_49189 [Cryphonectria parasitica EP155]